MILKIIKVVLFHLFCCLLGMGIVAINLTFTENHNTEIILYAVFTVIIVIAYLVFGYKSVDDYNESKNYISIWIISLLLVLFSFVDVQTATLVNLSFQPLGALLGYDILQEKSLCVLLSIVPSVLMQLGYALQKILKK